LLRIKPILSRDIDLLPSMDSPIWALSINLGDDGISKHCRRTRIRERLLSCKVDYVDVGLVSVGRKDGGRVGGGCVVIGNRKRNFVGGHGGSRNGLGGSLGMLSGSDIALVVAPR
jgi:hypothetical protein